MEVVALHLGVEQDKLTPDSDLTEDLNLQPLELADLAAVLMEKFGVEVHTAETVRWRTVGDVVRSVTEGGITGSPQDEVVGDGPNL